MRKIYVKRSRIFQVPLQYIWKSLGTGVQIYTLSNFQGLKLWPVYLHSSFTVFFSLSFVLTLANFFYLLPPHSNIFSSFKHSYSSLPTICLYSPLNIFLLFHLLSPFLQSYASSAILLRFPPAFHFFI